VCHGGWAAPDSDSTSIGQNPFTETIYFRKYSVYEGFLGENTRLCYESCAVGAFSGGFGQLWAILGFSGLLLHKYAVYEGFLASKYSFYAVGAPVP